MKAFYNSTYLNLIEHRKATPPQPSPNPLIGSGACKTVVADLGEGVRGRERAMKVFLSSTYLDLIEHRKAVVNALRTMGEEVDHMEIFGARDEEPTKASLVRT